MKIRVALPMLAMTLMPAFASHAAELPADETMNVVRNGEQASITGAPGNFVGNARIDPLFAARAPSTVSAGAVTFQPGARSISSSGPDAGGHLRHRLDTTSRGREDRHQTG